MQPTIFVITLPGSKQRQEAITTQLEKQSLDFRWIEGVNGRALTETERKQHYSEERAEHEGGRQLNPGEIGCALSHLKVYETLCAEGIELALILEDDATLAADFAAQLAAISNEADWQQIDLILLSHVQKYTAWGARSIAQGEKLIHPVVAYNGNGYLICRRGAEKLLKVLHPIYQPADCWNHLRAIKAIQIRGVVPYLVNHSSLSVESLIGASLREGGVRKQDQRTPLQQLKRIVYDKFLYQIAVKPLLRIRKQPIRW